ncbi:hypothetical protein E2986_10669 [Frieseomelitta varia]|uniref:LSM domain-containing protein n=1 Tax=Frieseomelitta varia TaxID=561572 RepID=A0A833RC76_9HYME|nr:hypothetical protein E2986_10669 [Frieseomelitta varia]
MEYRRKERPRENAKDLRPVRNATRIHGKSHSRQGRNDRSTSETSTTAADVPLHRKYGHVRSGIGGSRCALRPCTYFESLLPSLQLDRSRFPPSSSRFARSRLYLEQLNRHDERTTRDSPRFKRNNRSSFVPKVYTRNARGIRGHVEAYVAAFDKHWNLALEDCFEVWTRKVKRKAPALGNLVGDNSKINPRGSNFLNCFAFSIHLGAPSGVKTKEDAAPKVVVRKIEGKKETLERHVPQMLLRGEQVAIIVKIN